VVFAELDHILPLALTPNDPLYAPSSGRGWHLAKISAPNAWDTTLGSNRVIVAVLDTGVDGTHPDLAPNLVPGWNIYNNNADTSDVHGHGTAVAGTVAAVLNNGVGVASVAGGCRIMPIRISDPNGYASYTTIANGLIWAADRGARVANVSYRCSNSSTVATAAQYFQSRNGVVAVAAGNESTFDATADNPYVLTVSATDSSDSLTSWSNTGNNIDLAAPGSGIYTTLRGGTYGSKSGTSFSAPVVAGVAALVISVNPNLTEWTGAGCSERVGGRFGSRELGSPVRLGTGERRPSGEHGAQPQPNGRYHPAECEFQFADQRRNGLRHHHGADKRQR
jgi:thermitase